MAEARRLDEKAVMAWMADAGIDTSDTPGLEVLNEAINVAIVVRSADHLSMASPTHALPAFAGRMSGQKASFSGPPRIAKPIAVFFWIAVWLIMLRVVIKRHDRAMARYFATSSLTRAVVKP